MASTVAPTATSQCCQARRVCGAFSTVPCQQIRRSRLLLSFDHQPLLHLLSPSVKDGVLPFRRHPANPLRHNPLLHHRYRVPVVQATVNVSIDSDTSLLNEVNRLSAFRLCCVHSLPLRAPQGSHPHSGTALSSSSPQTSIAPQSALSRNHNRGS